MKNSENNILRVALLTRVSTDEQVLRGYSLQAQEDALVKYAKEHDMKIVGIYRDEGHSARKPVLKRPVMLQLLEDVKADKFDRILFIKLDRWFRNVSEYHSIQAILDKHNVTWQAILEDYSTASADGRLKVNIMLSVAENEADRTSERIKFVFDAKLAKKEAIFKLPFGYKVEMIDGVRRAVKDPETQHIVEDFIKRALATNISNAGLEMNQKYGLEFGYRFWSDIAKKDLYRGEYRGIKEFAPAYITTEEFRKLHRAQTNVNKAQENRVYLFSGLVKCPTCGRLLKAKSYGSKPNKEYFYYRCIRRNVGNCDYGMIPEPKIEKFVLENLRTELEAFVLSNEADQRTKGKANPQKSDLEKLQEKLRRLNVAYFEGNMTDEEYAKVAKTIKDKIAEAHAEAVKVETPADTEAIKALLATDYESLYETLTREEQRAIWRSVIDEIVLEGAEPVGIKIKA
jgi:DNA invertase Pin-like site-specific DNA recombinase